MEHEGLEGVETILHDLVVLLAVAVHGIVLLGGLAHDMQEERCDLSQVVADAESSIAAHGADAPDVLLLLCLARGGAQN